LITPQGRARFPSLRLPQGTVRRTSACPQAANTGAGDPAPAPKRMTRPLRPRVTLLSSLSPWQCPAHALGNHWTPRPPDHRGPRQPPFRPGPQPWYPCAWPAPATAPGHYRGAPRLAPTLRLVRWPSSKKWSYYHRRARPLSGLVPCHGRTPRSWLGLLGGPPPPPSATVPPQPLGVRLPFRADRGGPAGFPPPGERPCAHTGAFHGGLCIRFFSHSR